MGSDKSQLNYHGKSQRLFLYELLNPFCEEVFISCNSSQADSIPYSFKYIIDDEHYSGHGPISGLLSAFKINSDKSILFIGCES